MNKIIISIMGIFVMAGLVYALATFTATGGNLKVSSLQKGLVGHWVLDGESLNNVTNRTTDKTPYENHGTNYGATLTIDRMGQGNRAMSFDGVNDYVEIGTLSSPLDIGAGATMEVWVKPKKTDKDVFIVCNDYADQSRFYLTLYAGNYKYGLGATGTIDTGISAVVGQWANLVIVVKSDTKADVYLNGNYVTTLSYTSEPEDVTWLTIGRYFESLDYNFNGTIDEVRIYNRALSADEIDTLYHSYRPKVASGSLQKGLVLNMPLKFKYTKDETVGSEILTDRTPYSNDGQNYGATVGSSYTDFDGEDVYVNCGINADSFAMGNGDHTFSVWVYPTAVPELYNYIVAIGNSAEGKQSSLGITNAQKLYLSAYSSPIVTTAYVLPALDQWYHIVMVYNGETDTASFYVDGEWKEDESIILNTTIGKCFISAHTAALSYFTGTISDVRIYNRALSESEIKLLYDKGR